MKLFSVFAASATAISTDDRAFANVPSFITATDDWWNPQAAEKQFNDLVVGTNQYFDTFYQSNARAIRAGENMLRHLKRTQSNLRTMEARCTDPGRKRRDTEGPSERWTMPNDPRQALFQLFWAHARWARNQIFENCPKDALRMYKRLDRLQIITAWQYCDKVDENEGFCNWALWNHDGSRKIHPRRNGWIDHNFGRDVETPFAVKVCEWGWQGPEKQELTCPFGGTIHIEKAVYGRWNDQSCRGNRESIPGKCSSFVDVIDYATNQCEGKASCTIVADNKIMGDVVARQDPCHGVPKYTDVKWVCGDYKRNDPDYGYEIACEHASQEGSYTIEMSCPENQTIVVTEAQYGRWSGATCPKGGHVSYRPSCDKYVDVIDAAQRKCNDQRTCSFRADNNMQGMVEDRQDPCWGVIKYTRAKYVCQ